MRKKIILAILLAGAASPARSYELPSSTGTHRVVFSSEQGDFNENTRVINLQGNVQLDELGPDDKLVKTIKAGRLTVDSSSSTVYAPEDFVLNDASGTISGKSGVFNYAQSTGYINNARLNQKNFFISGKRGELTPSRQLYKKAEFTSCEDIPAHFKIKASRVYLAPNKYFLSFNNFFYLGRVPVLYFPVLYKPLIPGTPFVSAFNFGHDHRNEYFVRSSYSYRFNSETRGKLYLDHFGNQGFGTGAEVDYRNEKTIANISAYRIREYGTVTDRWGMNGGYWRRLDLFSGIDSASYYSQSYFRLLSDPEFNNDYFRTNPFAISPDRQANLAFTRTSNTTVTRVSAAVRYEGTADMKRFDKVYEAAPRLDFQKLPFTIGKTPFLHSFGGYFESAKEIGVPYYQRKGAGTWTVAQTVPLAHGVTLAPSIFYNQSLYVATSPLTTNRWTGRYGSNVNLRYDRLLGSLDLTHSYQARMTVNRMEQDRGAGDKGEETNSLFSQIFLTPAYNTYFKTNISYDMRSWVRGAVSKRLSPLFAELYHAPRKNLNIYVQDSYIFAEGNSSLIAQVYAGDEKDYVGMGVANYSNKPNTYVVNQMLGFSLPWAKSWRAESILRCEITRFNTDRVRSTRFFEKGIVLYKDFHDFHTTWSYKVRRGVKEFFFLVSLKKSDDARRDSFEDVSRNFWHPWRKEGDLRD